jgi:gliding motility-associated-like protein/uncharacterized repeat protein (TIGR01451 family)
MKSFLIIIVTAVTLIFFPKVNFGQAITLGPAAAKFVLFTSSGAVGDNVSAHSHITGDVGTDTPGPITGFGNVNGVMHPGSDAATTACGIALLATISQLNADPATIFPPSGSLGSGVIFTPGVYFIPGNATLTLDLILDAQGNPNAEFIIKIGGTFSANTLSRVKLINGALACHVYWQITNAVSMASFATMRGNIITGGAIMMGSGDSLEGRAFATPAGAITIDGITAFTPIGCNSPFLTGPKAPDLASANCYTIFSSNGALDGNLSSTSIGDVGSNSVASVTGWNAGNVTGALHLTPDPSTIQCAIDVSNLYDTLNAMVPDIELLYPSEFGNNLVLTPHVYLMNSGGAFGPAAFTDSLYLDAQGNANGVFVIKIIGGALTTSTYSKVKLINGAQSKNVFWMVDGAVSINNYSVFRGTIVVSAGALNLVNTGVVLDGRALTMTGAITSAGLAAATPPGSGATIITQPTNQIACAGSSLSFPMAASGSGLTYQWRKGNANLINGVKISGANSGILTINPVSISDTASNYNVVISGACSSKDTSINVSLKVDTAFIITTQPVNQITCAGSSVNFSIAAIGTGLTYQWRKGNVNLINGVKISGANSDTLKINPVSISDTASNYNVVITGSCSANDTSMNVFLTVDSAMIITAQPINQTVCAGSTASFSIAATGVNLTYQWRKGTAILTNAGNISGANSDTLKINPVSLSDTAFNYNVIIVGACSANDTSINVSLKVNAATVITTQPANQIACVGSSVSFSVVATGTGLTYQWRKGTVNITGATSPTLTINPVNITDAALNYNVVITGTCSNDTSINVSLTVNSAPIITTQPTNQTACVGSSVSFSVAATGTGLMYQWRKGTVDITGATSATLTINPVSVTDAALNYNVVIAGICSNDTSINVSLTVNSAPIITIQPTNQIACVGSSVSFSVVATGTGLTYQWRKGNVDITGATSATLTINPVSITDAALNYNVVITGTCSNDTSINVSLTVNTAPVITAQPVNQTACVGSSVSFSVFATGTGLTYQWRKGNIDIIGATSATLTINPVNITDAALNYNVVIIGTCSNDTSINVSLTVNSAPIITSQPTNQTACVGSSVSFSVVATGTGLTYQWRKGNVDITGATSATLTINPVNITDAALNYNVVIMGTCSNDTSINVSLTVNPIPVAIAGSNSPVCTGSSIDLTAQTVSGGTYAWIGPSGYSSSVQNPVILTSTTSDAGTYSLIVSSNGCISIPSVVTVIVGDCAADLSIIKTVSNTNPMIGHTVIFTITAANNGPADATGVTVIDILQSGYIYVSSTTTTGTYSNSTGVWTIGNLNNGASEILTITATVNSTGNYVNTATISGNEVDGNMANNVSSIETFPWDFFIPEGFSPNGDGINDLFVIRGIDHYSANTIEIYNRWGDKVFEASPYQNTWDGKSTMGLKVGGNELPIGTYFYVLNLGDGSNVYKGTIYLNR